MFVAVCGLGLAVEVLRFHCRGGKPVRLPVLFAILLVFTDKIEGSKVLLLVEELELLLKLFLIVIFLTLLFLLSPWSLCPAQSNL